MPQLGASYKFPQYHHVHVIMEKWEKISQNYHQILNITSPLLNSNIKGPAEGQLLLLNLLPLKIKVCTHFNNNSLNLLPYIFMRQLFLTFMQDTL